MKAATTAGFVLALAAAGNALALGLGAATGQAVLGQPLRVEIPLLGSGATLPAPECFRIRTPMAEVGGEFVPRDARIQVVGDRGMSKLIVTSSAIVREPLIGFAVVAGCGFALTKDYLLLTALPAEAPPAAVNPPQAASPPVAAPAASSVAPPSAKSAAKPTVAAPAAGEALRVDADITLEALARQKYPLQPKAREKFMRMMAGANPRLGADDGIIAAGTALQMPPGLPQRRSGPYRAGEGTAAPQPHRAGPGKDRLVVGGGTETNETKLLAEAERLTAILTEQAKTQDALNESIAKLENDYGTLQQRYTRLEQRLGHIEAERLAEKQAPKPASFDFLELLFAVLAGGIVGGLVLHVVQRRQLRDGPAVAADSSPAPLPAAAPRVVPPMVAPWARPAATTEAAAAAAASPAQPAPAAEQNVLDFHQS